MGKYDGPSFYKKDHPKIEPMKKKKQSFDQKHKESMPQNVRTRADIKRNATEYMETPSGHASVRKKTFRRQHIPASLQNLEGWQQTKRNDRLVNKIKKRLAKRKDTYLLFEEYMVESVEPEPSPGEQPKSTKKETLKKKARKKQPKKVRRKTKANAGLHRTLSNIMEEDQEAIENGKSKLDSLFYDD